MLKLNIFIILYRFSIIEATDENLNRSVSCRLSGVNSDSVCYAARTALILVSDSGLKILLTSFSELLGGFCLNLYI